MACAPSPITKDNIKAFMDSFDTVLSDCDGVLWRGNDVIGHANKVIRAFQECGKKVFFVTNHSIKTRQEYVKKCEDLGFKAAKEDILTTAYVLAQYLKQRGFKKKVYVVGSDGITKELDAVGIAHTGPKIDIFEGDDYLTLIKTVEMEPDVGAVAVAFDPHFSFPKILRASFYLDQPGCLFLATSTDERFPVSGEHLMFPGTACMVRSVEAVAKRPPEVMGKPHDKIFKVIQQNYNLDPKRTLMIGDRADTDILFGKNCGMQTMLVLSGVTSQADLDRWSKSSDPEDHHLLADYFLPQLDELLPLM